VNDEKLFLIVREADPLKRAVAPVEPPQAFLERVLGAARAEWSEPARGWWQGRSRFALLATAVALSAISAGIAVAATGWLNGEPAPPAVVTNFEAYTPQLGFHPNPGSAVHVAQDGDISLYATTNKEGTYCLDVTSPWKSSQTLDGGTCVPAATASGDLIAGLLGGSRNGQAGGQTTLVVGGRISDSTARTIRFTGPAGEVISRPVGSSGFFIAGVSTQAQPCASGDWTSTFTALDASGKELAQETIPLIRVVQQPSAQARNTHVCLFSFLRK
jgi:hypothetical protein